MDENIPEYFWKILYDTNDLKSNKETLETFLSSAEEYNKLYRSWIARLEENSWQYK